VETISGASEEETALEIFPAIEAKLIEPLEAVGAGVEVVDSFGADSTVSFKEITTASSSDSVETP
jgi:hypothetical protein